MSYRKQALVPASPWLDNKAPAAPVVNNSVTGNKVTVNWTHPDENPPVGLILCSSAGQSLVRYALDNLPGKILARAYRLALPEEKRLAKEMEKARRKLEPKRRLR